jgi:hypothetical protein
VARRVLSQRDVERFDHLPAGLAGAARLRTFPLLPPQAGAMTLGRTILIRPGREDDDDLLAHELVHVRQWADLGHLRFLVRYLGAYLANLARLRRHMAAYRAIPLEVEAREEAARWRRKHP